MISVLEQSWASLSVVKGRKHACESAVEAVSLSRLSGL